MADKPIVPTLPTRASVVTTSTSAASSSPTPDPTPEQAAWVKAHFYAPAARYTGLANEHAARSEQSSEGNWLTNNFITDWWTDDFSQVPVIGMGASNFGKGYQWAVDHRNQVLSYGLSALPGGTKTLDWDTAARITPGRMWVAMGVVETPGKDGYYRWMQAKQQEIAEFNRRIASGDAMAAVFDNPGTTNDPPVFVPQGWDIGNPEDEKWLFGDPTDPLGGASSPQDEQVNLMSGAVDTVATWFLDPLVVAGKGIKVFRVGSDMLGVVGQTTRSTNSARAVRQIESELDDLILHLDTNGAQGAIRGAGRDAVNIAARNATELRGEKWANGIVTDQVLDVAGMIDDPKDAAVFFGAMVGSQKYVRQLHAEQAAIADAFTALKRPNGYEMAAGNSVIGANRPPLLTELVESNVTGDGLLDDLIKRDTALAKALGIISETNSPISQVAGRLTTGAFGQTWRAGKSERDTVPTLFGRRNPRRPQYGPIERPASERFDETRALSDATAVSEARLSASIGPAAWEGGPRLYHGSAAAVAGDVLSPSSRGFNTTELSPLARKAADKGKPGEGAVYNVQWRGKNPPTVVDGTQRAPDWLKDSANKVIAEMESLHGVAFPSLAKAVGPKSKSSIITVLRAARRDMESAGLADDVVEAGLKRLRTTLKRKGVDALEHNVGGTPTTTFLNARKVRLVRNETAGTVLKTPKQILDEEMVPLVRSLTPNRLRTIDPAGSTPAVYEKVYQLSKNFRKVAVWEWINGQRGSGWLTVRGAEDGYAQDEWKAALRESRVLRRDQDFIRTLAQSWSHGVTETGNLQRAAEIEQEAVRQMARHYFGAEATPLQETIAMGLYRAAAKKRESALDAFQQSRSRAYGIKPMVDPDDGTLITTGPIMRSQLETKIPLLDFRLMDKVMSELASPAMKPYLREIGDSLLVQAGGDPVAIAKRLGSMSEGAKYGLEAINSAWKAAVLMRLGYTQRNVFEGWLRTWAVLGTIPALAPSNIATGIGRTFYRNPKAARGLKTIEGTQLHLSKVVEQERQIQLSLEDDIGELLARTIPEPTDLTITYDSRHLQQQQEMGGGHSWYIDRKRGLFDKDGRRIPDDEYPESWPPEKDGYFRAVIEDRDELPDFVYHVTTASTAVAQDGALRVSAGNGGGLGGAGGKGSVSFTTDRATALALRDDMRLYAALRAQAGTSSNGESIDEIIQILRQDALLHGADPDSKRITAVFDQMRTKAVRNGAKDDQIVTEQINEYMLARHYESPSRPNVPGFFSQPLHYADPTDINIIAIPKRNLPENAVIENIGHNKIGENHEIRVYGDVPIGKAQVSDVKNRVVYDQMLADTMGELESHNAVLDDYLSVMAGLSEKKKSLQKRYIGWDEAFAGPMGEIRRASASNMQTVKNFFESKAARDAQLRTMDDNKWVQVNPEDTQYFDELSGSVMQFRSDPLAQIALRMDGADGSIDSMMAFFRTDAGKKYARDMALFDDEARLRRATFLHGEIAAYLPTDEAMSLATRSVPPTGAELRAALGGRRDLSPIHGREVRKNVTSEDPYHAVINTIFKYLGSMPDSALVRQPFYNEVWKRETAALYRKAIDQGVDLSDNAVLKTIEETAHRRALKATNETLFTITRYSNPAAALRFLSPFFAAWENSMRTWSRIIIRDPSVAARGMILWDLPNNMGLTVDENGIPVGSSPGDFLTGSVSQYVVLPKFLTDHIQSTLTDLSEQPGLKDTFFGDVLQGAAQFPLKVPKGSFNIVAPGESPFLPGLGPVVTYPVGRLLASKPDKQQFLKEFLGDALYSQIAPFGQASGDILDTVAPAAGRKAVQLIMGEDNDDYMRVLDAVTVDAIVSWRLAGGDPDSKPDPAALKEYADNFYKFSILSSLVLPVAISRMSDYQPVMNEWRILNEDPTMPYRDKVALFIDKFGDSFMPLTRSTSKSDIEGLDPTLEMWQGMTKHAREVAMLTAEVGDSGASILAATIPNGKFNAGVYSYWRNERQPGAQNTYKTAMTPEEIMVEDTVGRMWDDYIREKTMRDNALARLGTATYDSAKARDAGITARWDSFIDGMFDKYGEDFAIHGPQSYTKQLPQTLGGIQKLLNDEQFMSSDLGESATWQAIDAYMDERNRARAAIDKGADKGAVLEVFNEFAAAHKYSTLQFADFFDTFLENDDLTARVG